MPSEQAYTSNASASHTVQLAVTPPFVTSRATGHALAPPHAFAALHIHRSAGIWTVRELQTGFQPLHTAAPARAHNTFLFDIHTGFGIRRYGR